MNNLDSHPRIAARVAPVLFALACSVSVAEPVDPTGFAPDGSAGLFWLRSEILQAPATDPSLYFGISVDMSGDFLAVGSHASAEDGSSLAGRVYVYRRVGSEWQLDTTLVSPAGAQQGAIFGNSVAIASTPDGVVLVVGEPGRDMWTRGIITSDVGVVWVFERIDGAWVETELMATPSPHALLGFSVDTDGSHVIAGGPGHEDNHGEVVVWRREGELWIADHSLTALEIGASVGYSVAIAGNLALIGAPGASYLGDAAAGLALIKNLLADDEPVGIVLHDPTPDATELFGIAVAATSNRFAVGSIQDDAPGGDPDSGAAHVFELQAGIAHLDATFRSPGPQEDANFGSALAFDGERLVIGERSRDVFLFGSTLASAGAMHLFRHIPETDSWIYETGLYNFGENEQLGWSVATDGHRVAAGVPTRANGAQMYAGAADVFEADLIFADDFD